MARQPGLPCPGRVALGTPFFASACHVCACARIRLGVKWGCVQKTGSSVYKPDPRAPRVGSSRIGQRFESELCNNPTRVVTRRVIQHRCWTRAITARRTRRALLSARPRRRRRRTSESVAATVLRLGVPLRPKDQGLACGKRGAQDLDLSSRVEGESPDAWQPISSLD